MQQSNCRGASRPLLNHGLHAINATPARWRGGVVSLRSIQPARRHSRRERTWWRVIGRARLTDLRAGYSGDDSYAATYYSDDSSYGSDDGDDTSYYSDDGSGDDGSYADDGSGSDDDDSYGSDDADDGSYNDDADDSSYGDDGDDSTGA